MPTTPPTLVSRTKQRAARVAQALRLRPLEQGRLQPGPDGGGGLRVTDRLRHREQVRQPVQPLAAAVRVRGLGWAWCAGPPPAACGSPSAAPPTRPAGRGRPMAGPRPRGTRSSGRCRGSTSRGRRGTLPDVHPAPPRCCIAFAASTVGRPPAVRYAKRVAIRVPVAACVTVEPVTTPSAPVASTAADTPCGTAHSTAVCPFASVSPSPGHRVGGRLHRIGRGADPGRERAVRGRLQRAPVKRAVSASRAVIAA